MQMRKELLLELKSKHMQHRLLHPETKPQAHDWEQQDPPAVGSSLL